MPVPKLKIPQNVLSDFSATVKAKPNLTEDELLDKFPEFKKDKKYLQSAIDYTTTATSGKYKTAQELNSKFPEFEIVDETIEKKNPLGNALPTPAPKPTIGSATQASPLPIVEGDDAPRDTFAPAIINEAINTPQTGDLNMGKVPVASKEELVDEKLRNENKKEFALANPIDLYKHAQELEGKQDVSISDVGAVAVDAELNAEAQKKSKEIKDYLKAQGLDEESLKAASEIPESWNGLHGFSKDEIVQGLKENKTATLRRIANAKWSIPLVQSISEGGGDVGRVNHLIDVAQNQNLPYAEKRQSNRELYNIIATSDIPHKEDALKNFAIDHSYAYGTIDPNNSQLQEQKKQFPNLSENQLIAKNYLEDVMPDKAAGYEAALVDPKEFKDNPNALLGQEEKLKRLEEIGINLRQNALQEKITPLTNKYKELVDISQQRPLTPDEEQEVADIQKYISPLHFDLNMLNQDKQDLLTKFPKAGVHDAQLFAQEILGQKHTGLDWLALESGKATENAAQSIYDLVSEPFASKANENMRQNEILGNEMNNEQSTHLSQKNQTTQSFTPTIKEGSELETYIDSIKEDKTLTDNQKRDAVTVALMKNPDQWQRTPIEGGKSNIGLASMLYGTGSLAANIAPFVLMETATGGGATAGFAKKFASNFTSVMATSFHQELANNLDKGVQNPYYKAAVSTGINAIAMGGAQTGQEIRKLAAGTKSAIGDAIAKMSDDEIVGYLKKPPAALTAFQKAAGIGKNLLGAVKEGFTTAAKIQPLMTAGQIVNDANNGELKSAQDYASQGLIEGLKFGIMGTALGSVGAVFKDVNELNKASLYEAANDPKRILAALDQKIENNSISKQEADVVRGNVEKAADLIKKLPFVNDKGKPLSERGKRDLLYLKMQETELNDNIKKDIPEPVKEKLETELEKTQQEIKKVYSGITVIRPEENKPADIREIAPKENTPEEKSKGAAIILPETAPKPNVVEIKKGEPDVVPVEAMPERTPAEVKDITREIVDTDAPVKIPDVESYNSETKQLPLKEISAMEGRTMLRKRLKDIDKIINCLT